MQKSQKFTIEVRVQNISRISNTVSVNGGNRWGMIHALQLDAYSKGTDSNYYEPILSSFH